LLKKKRELNYRRATERFERCKYCLHKKWVPIMSCASGPDSILRYDWRCGIIGLDNSNKYGIRNDHVCDEYIRGNHETISTDL
jgi:hypothetical protein